MITSILVGVVSIVAVVAAAICAVLCAFLGWVCARKSASLIRHLGYGTTRSFTGWQGNGSSLINDTCRKVDSDVGIGEPLVAKMIPWAVGGLVVGCVVSLWLTTFAFSFVFLAVWSYCFTECAIERYCTNMPAETRMQIHQIVLNFLGFITEVATNKIVDKKSARVSTNW